MRHISLLGLALLATGMIPFAAGQTCGDTMCDGSVTRPPEDASTCFEDCSDAITTSCTIDKEAGGTCTVAGTTYDITMTDIGEADCGTGTYDIAVFARFDGHTRNLTMSHATWRQLADGTYIRYALEPCSAYSSTYDVFLSSHCDGTGCGIAPSVTFSRSTLLSGDEAESFTVTTNLPAILEGPHCTTRIRPDGGAPIRPQENAGCTLGGEKRFPFLDPGDYTYEVDVKDAQDGNTITTVTVPFTVNGCETDAACDDRNPCTTDRCTGSPRTCTNERTPGCPVNGTCIEPGTRVGSSYCGNSNTLTSQKVDGSACIADYQCASGTCRDGACYRGIVGNIIQFLTALF